MENESREDSLQNAKQCLPDCFYMRNCANDYNTTLGHNMFFDIYKLSSRIGCSDTLAAVCRQFKSTSAIALPNRLPE